MVAMDRGVGERCISSATTQRIPVGWRERRRLDWGRGRREDHDVFGRLHLQEELDRWKGKEGQVSKWWWRWHLGRRSFFYPYFSHLHQPNE